MIPYRLWVMLAFSRIPGNAFSFWVRKTLRWSRGLPTLPNEAKEHLFAYLGDAAATAEARERKLRAQYRLDPFSQASTQALYRKNLYLIEILEQATQGLTPPVPDAAPIKALDVGSQDWHYVFGLERWLRHHSAPRGRQVSLQGIEVDGYGIYPDFRSRKDYAQAYAAQTANPSVTYRVEDFLASTDRDCDLITVFYPFVTRHHLLLWGLPLSYFQPMKILLRAADATRPGGWLMVFTHTQKEHDLLLEFGRQSGRYELLKEGPAVSNLVDFHEDVTDRRFSVWRRL